MEAEETANRMAQQPSLAEKQSAARLGDLFGQLMTKTLSRRLLKEMPEAQRFDLTFAQMNALRYIWQHERVLVGDLAEGLDISFPSATNMVKRLEEKGLAQRAINPRDRREVEILLSGEGCALVERFENERVSRFTAFLERMEETERLAFLDGLQKFVRFAVGDDACTADDICLRCGWRASAQCPLAEIIPLFLCK